MKAKNMEIAKRYFSDIFCEENLPMQSGWHNEITDNEIQELIKKEDKIKRSCIVVDQSHDLYDWSNDYLAMEVGHSRRGQFYFILCKKDTLELSVYATKPDGDGGDVLLPNILLEMIKNDDVII